jgi:hypothetical protein
MIDWPAWEQQLIQGPNIRRWSCRCGHCADVLKEAARYLPHLHYERFRLAHSLSRDLTK